MALTFIFLVYAGVNGGYDRENCVVEKKFIEWKENLEKLYEEIFEQFFKFGCLKRIFKKCKQIRIILYF